MWKPLTMRPDGAGYGLGWGISEAGGYQVVGHSGGQVGTSTILLLVPEKRLAVAAMANVDDVDLDPMAREILQWYAAPRVNKSSARCTSSSDSSLWPGETRTDSRKPDVDLSSQPKEVSFSRRGLEECLYWIILMGGLAAIELGGVHGNRQLFAATLLGCVGSVAILRRSALGIQCHGSGTSIMNIGY